MSIQSSLYWQSNAERAAAVVPNDSANLTLESSRPSNSQSARALWVGGTGTVKVTLDGQRDTDAVTFAAVPAGTLLPFQIKKVWATGTTATLIVALF